MGILRLEQSLNSGQIEEAISKIEKVGLERDTSYAALLIKHLEQTDNHMLRNAIAIALAEMECNDALEPLIKLLSSPKTKGSRGTLLYVLESFDYSPHVLLITSMLNESSFEVSRHSFQLLEAISEQLSEEIKEECRTIIIDMLKLNADEFLEEALELFE